VARVGERRGTYRVVEGIPEGKGPFTRSRRREIDFNEIDWEGVKWNDLAQDRDRLRAVVNTVINLRAR